MGNTYGTGLKPQFKVKWSFKVIYRGDSEKPLTDNITYNNYDLISKI